MLAIHFQCPQPTRVRQKFQDFESSKSNFFELAKRPKLETKGIFERAYHKSYSRITERDTIPLPSHFYGGVNRAYRIYVVCMHRMMEADHNRFAAEPRDPNSISPHNPEFRQFHQPLLYARLARHWAKLVNLSYNTASDESKYMRVMAKQHSIALKHRRDALVSGFLVWTLHKVTKKNEKEFNRLRGNVRYHLATKAQDGLIINVIPKAIISFRQPATLISDCNPSSLPSCNGDYR